MESTEAWLLSQQSEGLRLAAKLIMEHSQLYREPSQHADGHPVIGWSRRLRDFPLSDAAAMFLLQEQLKQTKQELWIRITETCVQAPMLPARIAVVYVLAGVVGMKRLVDWQPFWTALKSSRYQDAAIELMASNLTAILGDTTANKRLVAAMIATLISGQLSDSVH